MLSMPISGDSSQKSGLEGHGRSSPQSKSVYQIARPARHAHHPFHKMRPELLMQLQQISQMGRPMLLLDVFPSTGFMPFLTWGLALYFRRWGSLSSDDVAIVQNTLCEMAGSTVNSNIAVSKEEGRASQEIIAKISQPVYKDMQLQEKTDIYLGLDSSCEAFCLSDGSYEFIQHGENGIRTMRWVLRHKKSRRMSSCSHLDDVRRLFTFSIIDPGTRRHAVIATMIRDRMEVSASYCLVDSENQRSDVDERLRKIILVTGIWVALREKWT